MTHFSADFCNLHIKVNNFKQGDNLPVAISVLQSTGWQAPPKEVCSVNGNLAASTTTVLFESLPIGVPLFLSITGSVKLADGKSDALISGLEGYLGGNATLHVEAIRSNNINNGNMPPQQRQGWNDGTRRMERQYSIDRHQQPHNQAQNVSGGGDLVIISNSLSTLERKVKDAERLQCEIKDEMEKVLYGLKNAKSRSSGDSNEYVSLEQRISKLSKSSIFNNDLMQELSNTDYKKSAESSNNNNKYNNNNSSSSSSSSSSSVNINNRNNNRMNDVNQNNLDPYKLDRKMSVQSRQRIMKLDDINNRVGVCQSEFNGLMDTLRISNNHTDKMKIKDALSQLYGNLEKLQFVEIDSVVVGDLQSGQKEAREVRKRLTKQVTNLLNEVKDAVKQLQA
jgi:hypothetical protein